MLQHRHQLPQRAGVEPAFHLNPSSAGQQDRQLTAVSDVPRDFRLDKPLRLVALRFLLSITRDVPAQRLQRHGPLPAELLARSIRWLHTQPPSDRLPHGYDAARAFLQNGFQSPSQFNIGNGSNRCRLLNVLSQPAILPIGRYKVLRKSTPRNARGNQQLGESPLLIRVHPWQNVFLSSLRLRLGGAQLASGLIAIYLLTQAHTRTPLKKCGSDCCAAGQTTGRRWSALRSAYEGSCHRQFLTGDGIHRCEARAENGRGRNAEPASSAMA